MKHSRPLMAVITGGTSLGKTRSERQIGTLRPVLDVAGEDSGEYHVVSLTGYVEARVYRGASLDWRVTMGDPYDMDSPSKTLPDGYGTRLDAASAAAKRSLLASGERCTYIKYGER